MATGRVKSKTTNLVFVASLLKHAAFRSKRKDWSTHNQDNVSEWTDISTCRMLIHYKNPTKLIGLVQSGHQLIDMRLVLAMK